MNESILLVDDEAIIRKILKKELELVGFQVDTAKDGQEALDAIKSQRYDVVILDNNMPRKTGIEILPSLKTQDAVVILITAYASVNGAVEAMKLGADDYLTKPFDSGELIEKINQYLAIRNRQRAHKATPPRTTDSKIVGSSNTIHELRALMNKVKDIETTVLILGENGTGKSIVAKELHQIGQRRSKPFVHVDCASLPPSLIESELFGHEKGSFTGALDTKRGKFEQAEDGTILLDEISLLPLELQGKLLNVLQEKKFTRIGGERAYSIRARVLAATNENLEEAVKKGSFRADLFYRLNVIKVECPPLRYRRDDIPQLAHYFLDNFAEKFGIPSVETTPEFLDHLREYHWPGNVRELENSLEGMLALADTPYLTVDNLPIRMQGKKDRDPRPTETPSPTEYEEKDNLLLKNKEYQTIARALEKHEGHRQNTAEELGISRRTLQYKLKQMKEEYGVSF